LERLLPLMKVASGLGRGWVLLNAAERESVRVCVEQLSGLLDKVSAPYGPSVAVIGFAVRVGCFFSSSTVVMEWSYLAESKA